MLRWRTCLPLKVGAGLRCMHYWTCCTLQCPQYHAGSRDCNTAANNTVICDSGVTDLELNGHHHSSSKQHRGGWEGPAVPAEVQNLASCILLHDIFVVAIE